MDDASWRALYMTQPIEREGQLYPENELRRYFELPDREPDGIISICDTKDKGTDYAFMQKMCIRDSYDDMRDIPSVDAAPVVHGRWIKKHDNVRYWYECSECGRKPPYLSLIHI